MARVRFKLYSTHLKKLYKVANFVLLLMFFIGLVYIAAIFFIDINIGESSFYTTLFVIYLILLISSGFIAKVMEKSDFTGNIYLDTNLITISENSETIDYDLNDVEDLKVKINGYFGQNIPSLKPRVFVRKGDENFIQFKIGNFKKKYEFHLNNIHDYNNLYSILNSWRVQNKKFAAYDYWNKEIKHFE